MKKRSLIKTNPYLKDPAEREDRIVINVATSSAIEGIPLSAFGTFLTSKKGSNGKAACAAVKSTRSLRRKSSPSAHSSD
jgi:hypothetical protein